MAVLMKCGHVANAKTSTGRPVCVICAGHRPEADMIDKECTGTDGLEGRQAACTYCGCERQSAWELPFFTYHPEAKTDGFYCGCFGWD